MHTSGSPPPGCRKKSPARLSTAARMWRAGTQLVGQLTLQQAAAAVCQHVSGGGRRPVERPARCAGLHRNCHAASKACSTPDQPKLARKSWARHSVRVPSVKASGRGHSASQAGKSAAAHSSSSARCRAPAGRPAGRVPIAGSLFSSRASNCSDRGPSGERCLPRQWVPCCAAAGSTWRRRDGPPRADLRPANASL